MSAAGGGAYGRPRQAPAAAGARRLYGGRARVGSSEPVRRAALRLERGDSELYRRSLRDDLRPDNDRRDDSEWRRAAWPRRPLLALTHAVDGRHGRSGAVSGADAAPRRRGTPHARREPRPHQVQARPQGRPDGEDPLRHLHRPDAAGVGRSAHRGHELVRRSQPRLHHDGHRRLLREKHEHRGL